MKTGTIHGVAHTASSSLSNDLFPPMETTRYRHDQAECSARYIISFPPRSTFSTFGSKQLTVPHNVGTQTASTGQSNGNNDSNGRAEEFATRIKDLEAQLATQKSENSNLTSRLISTQIALFRTEQERNAIVESYNELEDLHESRIKGFAETEQKARQLQASFENYKKMLGADMPTYLKLQRQKVAAEQSLAGCREQLQCWRDAYFFVTDGLAIHPPRDEEEGGTPKWTFMGSFKSFFEKKPTPPSLKKIRRSFCEEFKCYFPIK